MLTSLDRLLESHPIDRLERWIDFASAHGTTDAEKDYYEHDARRIITIWGPPSEDYAARMWSGLVRDFYRERMAAYFEARKSGKTFDRQAFEEKWVHATGVSPCQPYPDPMAAALDQIAQADSWSMADAPLSHTKNAK